MHLLVSNYTYIIRYLDRKVNLFSQEKTLAEQAKAIETAKIQYAELRKVNIKLAQQFTTLLAERNTANTLILQYFKIAKNYQHLFLSTQKNGKTP